MPPIQSTNPKDRIGVKKPPVSLVPPALNILAAEAMRDGAAKYGTYNWRESKVIASIYVAALKRHLDSWWDGEECAQDSGVHHLGHAAACLAILIDAQSIGQLIDDRPPAGAAAKMIAELTKK